MLRISTTTLESFRWVMNTEVGSEMELIEAIKGSPFSPTWQMQGGTAWHTALEEAVLPEEDQEPVAIGRFSFRAGAIRAARKHIGPGLWEVKATKAVSVLGHPVTVVAKADHVRGLGIQDAKTRWVPAQSPAKPWQFDNSLQWRFYLWTHEASRFRYNRFVFDEPYGGLCALRDIQSFTYYPYADLHADCMEWLEQFVLFAEHHKLFPFLAREGTSPNLPGDE